MQWSLSNRPVTLPHIATRIILRQQASLIITAAKMQTISRVTKGQVAFIAYRRDQQAKVEGFVFMSNVPVLWCANHLWHLDCY